MRRELTVWDWVAFLVLFLIGALLAAIIFRRLGV